MSLTPEFSFIILSLTPLPETFSRHPLVPLLMTLVECGSALRASATVWRSVSCQRSARLQLQGFPLWPLLINFLGTQTVTYRKIQKNRLLQVFSAFKLTHALLFIGISKSVSLKIKRREPLINPCLILTNINPCLIQQMLKKVEWP